MECSQLQSERACARIGRIAAARSGHVLKRLPATGHFRLYETTAVRRGALYPPTQSVYGPCNYLA